MKLNIIYFRVGTTRSGKTIPCTSNLDDITKISEYFQKQHFSDDDLLDAYALFEFLTLRAARRADEDTNFKDHADKILEMIPVQSFIDAKTRANITSAFDLRDLGQSRAAAEFIDL